MKKLVIFDFLGTIDSEKAGKDIIESIKNISRNYVFAIVSSTPFLHIRGYLEKNKIASVFSDILGFESGADKVFKIKSLLRKYNVLPQNTVFVTDTLGDILEGGECGVNLIGVTWGLHSREMLQKGNPVMIIDDPKDLENAIENVLK